MIREGWVAGVALVDVGAARDGGEPVEGGHTDRVVHVFPMLRKDRNFSIVGVDPGPGEATSGF